MHGLRACLFKCITVAAFHIFAQCGEYAAKGKDGGCALNSHGNYIVDHGQSLINHGIVFLNYCGNPVISKGQKSTLAWNELKQFIYINKVEGP